VVERQLPKLNVKGSNPFTRSKKGHRHKPGGGLLPSPTLNPPPASQGGGWVAPPRRGCSCSLPRVTGEGRGGGRSTPPVKDPCNLIQDRVDLSKHLPVGEADHGVAALFQVGRPRVVVFDLRCVAIAVDLDYQLGAGTAEIHDEAPDGMLPPKLEAAQLPAPQPGPQLLLRRRLFAPQLFRAPLDGFGGAPAFVVGHLTRPPSIPPASQGGGQVVPASQAGDCSLPCETGEGRPKVAWGRGPLPTPPTPAATAQNGRGLYTQCGPCHALRLVLVGWSHDSHRGRFALDPQPQKNVLDRRP
jgi:hypothetical protein